VNKAADPRIPARAEHVARAIDVAALDVLDSFGSRTLRNIAEMARLRGAVTVLVGIQPDVAMERLVDEAMRPHRAMLDEVVGETSVGLHRDTNLYAPMDDALLAAVARAAGTDIAFSNGWRYGAPIPHGPLRPQPMGR